MLTFARIHVEGVTLSDDVMTFRKPDVNVMEDSTGNT
jgi:hypothetical protein